MCITMSLIQRGSDFNSKLEVAYYWFDIGIDSHMSQLLGSLENFYGCAQASVEKQKIVYIPFWNALDFLLAHDGSRIVEWKIKCMVNASKLCFLVFIFNRS